MRGLILAAGRGSRLGEGVPKCLLRLGRRTLLQAQVDLLRSVGVTEVGVVTGYAADAVRAVGGPACHYVHNAEFAETNSLYSLWLAREWAGWGGPVVQVNCDVVADARVYRRLTRARGTALAYDSTSGQLDEHMKVRIERGLLREIRKDMTPPAGRGGESLGLIKYDPAGAAAVLAAADFLVRAGQVKAWAPAAIGRAVTDGGLAVRCVDVAGLPWAEIDFVEDALFARYEVWPAVRPRAGGARARRSLAGRVVGGMAGAGRGLVRTVAGLGGMLDGLM